MNEELKLYVWGSPYLIPFGHSMIFAIAHNLREARKQTKQGKSYSFGIENDDRHSKVKLGKPTRIVKLPCAEWHEWEE